MKGIYLITLLVVFIACNNQYKKYGFEVSYRERHSNTTYLIDSSRLFAIKFASNSFNITDRNIEICLDTLTIYKGEYFADEKLVYIPNELLDEKIIPNFFIIKPQGEKAYYFESKDDFIIPGDSKRLEIHLYKKETLGECIEFRASE